MIAAFYFMPVLHYRVHILTVENPTHRLELLQSQALRRALLMEIDEQHWLIDSKYIKHIERACAKAGITLTEQSHGN